METIRIKSLECWGMHGRTGDEQTLSQPFCIDIEVTFDGSKSFVSDELSDTIDYVLLETIAVKIIEGTSHVLLETLADDIINEIFSQTIAKEVTVTIKKPRARISRSIPGVTVKRLRNFVKDKPLILDFDMTHVLSQLDTVGGVSIPILDPDFRHELLSEARKYTYTPMPEYVESSGVREDLSSISEFPYDSLIFKLKEEFEKIFIQKLCEYGEENIFTKKIRFSELSLQHYKQDSFGIETHKDFSSSINLICVFILTGHGRFGITQARNKENPYLLDTSPGNVILLRAPGYRGGGPEIRPFHFIDQITEDRIVLGFRQTIK